MKTKAFQFQNCLEDAVDERMMILIRGIRTIRNLFAPISPCVLFRRRYYPSCRVEPDQPHSESIVDDTCQHRTEQPPMPDDGDFEKMLIQRIYFK